MKDSIYDRLKGRMSLHEWVTRAAAVMEGAASHSPHLGVFKTCFFCGEIAGGHEDGCAYVEMLTLAKELESPHAD